MKMKGMRVYIYYINTLRFALLSLGRRGATETGPIVRENGSGVHLLRLQDHPPLQLYHQVCQDNAR